MYTVSRSLNNFISFILPSGISILLYFLSFWFCKPSYDNESHHSSKETGHENMTDNSMNGDALGSTESAL